MDSVKKAVIAAVDPLAPRWIELSDKIHANPETNFKEYKASKWLTDAARELGCSVELGVGGIDTAFTATYDSGKPGPAVGVIVEYDALEGLGHACAHNTKGPGALLGLEAFIKAAPDFRGKIVVFGCPAEEGGGGKVIMAENNVFDNVDVCLEFGTSSEWGTGPRRFARQRLLLTARGKSAHAALRNLKSINAFDALLYVLENFRYLRKTLGDDGLINAVMLDGGKAPSVIPDLAVVNMEVRALKRSIMDKYVDLVERVVSIAADASGAKIDIKKSSVYADAVKCPSLANLIMDNFKEFGLEDPQWLLDEDALGSSDVGNVSHIVPTETINIGLGKGLVAHTAEYREASGGEPGHRVVVDGAKVLDMCLADLLVHDGSEFLARVKAEFDAAEK